MLRARNFSKRITENTPPSITSHKSSRSQRAFNDAARRRRARTTAKRSVKYDVEQAKRKTQKNPVRLNVVVVAQNSDIDMQDAQTVPHKIVPVLLPRTLGQPPISEPTEDAIKAASPYFSGETAEFVRDNLVERGPRMLRTAISVRADVDSHTLPKELAVMVHDMTAVDLPTHMLAVYAPVPKNTASSHRTQVKMYPIHSLVMAAHCAKLPPFAPSPATTINGASEPTSGPRQITLPVRPLCLPHPSSFPYLTQYFYLRQAEVFHTGFFPASPPDAYVEDPQNPQNILSFALHLGKTFNPTALLERASTIHGVWMNACALGAFDNELWAAIDSAWEVILNALAIGTGNPRAVVIPPAPQPASSGESQH